MARLWFDYAARERYVTDGVNDAWMVTTASLGREGSAQRDDSPFLVANEWIAGNLAWFLRLPVPPFALMRRRGQKCMFTSLHYDPRNNVAPGDCDPEILAKRDPETSTGIILFDILIANFDRHRGNLKVDSPDDPTQVFVIDNERGVFAHMPGDVPKRFVKLANKLGISGTKCDPLCSRHCLLDYLPTSEFMLGWWGLIQTIPPSDR